MVALADSHTNATSKRWHLREIDLRFAINSTPGWLVWLAIEGSVTWLQYSPMLSCRISMGFFSSTIFCCERNSSKLGTPMLSSALLRFLRSSRVS